MPTYDYECQACGHAFEKFHSITASPIKTCPVCKKRRVRRLIGTGAGVIFKGSGFYQTDYRSDSYKKAAEKDKPSTGDASQAKKSKPASDAGAAKAETSPKKQDSE